MQWRGMPPRVVPGAAGTPAGRQMRGKSERLGRLDASRGVPVGRSAECDGHGDHRASVQNRYGPRQSLWTRLTFEKARRQQHDDREQALSSMRARLAENQPSGGCSAIPIPWPRSRSLAIEPCPYAECFGSRER